MAVSLEVEVTGSSTSPTVYTVQWRTLSATDMPGEIYVFDYASMLMSRIAAPDDMAWPVGRTSGKPYYRAILGSADYASLAEAEAGKVAAAAAIQSIVDHYKSGLASFVGVVTTVYT